MDKLEETRVKLGILQELVDHIKWNSEYLQYDFEYAEDGTRIKVPKKEEDITDTTKLKVKVYEDIVDTLVKMI